MRHNRGIPTEEVLQQMREAKPPIFYLVGTPKARLGKLEARFLDQPWNQVREGIEVKLMADGRELYLLTQSRERVNKERAMRRRQLKALCKRLRQLQGMKLRSQALLLKLGEAKGKYRAAWRLLDIQLPEAGAAAKGGLNFGLNRERLRETRRREGRYLLRTNLSEHAPEKLWQLYTQLTQVEEAFKNLKGDLALRPIFHQLQERIEAHIFVAFLAYCLHANLRYRLSLRAPGLTPRAVLEKFATIQMLDAYFPTHDGRWLIFSRYTQPEKDHRLLLEQLGLELPAQSPPRITAKGEFLPT
jgi:hypothetical protein